MTDPCELGEVIDDGQAAFLVVGQSEVGEALERDALRAEKHVAKELDISPQDIDQAVRGAAAQLS